VRCASRPADATGRHDRSRGHLRRKASLPDRACSSISSTCPALRRRPLVRVRVLLHEDRFGTTQSRLFEMQTEGLAAIRDASASSSRPLRRTPGSMPQRVSGTRPLCLRIQASSTRTRAAISRRHPVGVERSAPTFVRCSTVTPNVNLGSFDVFVSAVGGVRHQEPGPIFRLRLRCCRRNSTNRCRRRRCVRRIGLAGEVRQVVVLNALAEARNLDAGKHSCTDGSDDERHQIHRLGHVRMRSRLSRVMVNLLSHGSP